MFVALSVLAQPIVPCHCGSNMCHNHYNVVSLNTTQPISPLDQICVCTKLTNGFLNYSLEQGIDLVTTCQAWGFMGLKAGDQLCVSLKQWLQAYRACCAPKVVLESTPQSVLKYVSIEMLEQYATTAIEIDNATHCLV